MEDVECVRLIEMSGLLQELARRWIRSGGAIAARNGTSPSMTAGAGFGPTFARPARGDETSRNNAPPRGR